MTKWYRTEADKSWLIHISVDAKNSNKWKLEGAGGGRGGRGATDTAVNEHRNEMVHGVAKHLFD